MHPPACASSHDRRSIGSTPPRNPSPHPQPVSTEETELPASSQLSQAFETLVQTATSPMIPASSPPPGLNYEGRGDQETNIDSIIDQDRNVFIISSEPQQVNSEVVSMDLETPSITQTPPVSVVTGKRSTNLRSVSPPPPAKRIMREISPSDERVKLEALKEYNERSEELLTMVTILAKQEESLKSLGVPLPGHSPTVDNFVMRVQLRNVEAELEAERKRCRELELNLSDIRRECKEPFFVPSLFDAFLQISQLTTAVTEHIS
ncbi:hypothetical protein F5146DRAFT_131328 [Armillaria mellea]|nr:hypothetical protein F5146DRAFT_131328 [Armillaria mellea]